MNWLKQYPFLAAVSGAAIVLVAAGGFMISSELGRLDEEQAAFDQKTSQLNQLERNKPYPDKASVDAALGEQEVARAELESIAEGLAVSVPSASPQSFQDELAKLVKDLVERAAAKNIELPEKFYLGFEKYQSELPSPDIASKLTLQLRSVYAVASVLLDAQIKSLGPILRAPLAGEAGPPATEQGGNARAKKDTKAPLLELAPFDVSFASDQSAFRLAFNRIVEIEPPVFVRLVGIDNSAPAPPPKTAPGGAATNPAPAGGEAASEDAGGIKAVVGRETLTVNLRLASVVSSEKSPAKVTSPKSSE